MALNTFSCFYYGFEITTDNNIMNFAEGMGPELTAELEVGIYSLTDMLAVIETALDTAGALTYTATVNRATRAITISATGTFSLLTTSGTLVSTSPYELLGFTGADKTGMTTYTGTAAGSIYEPQFRLQDYIPVTNWTGAALATVNKSASGRVEVVKFGDESFMQCDIKYATNILQTDNMIIKNNASGVEALIDFMSFAITKGPMEFMEDIGNRSTFVKLILESTPDSKDGVSFKLKELYDKGLPEFYDTGTLKFRLLEE
jgi:hypothetical protein